MQNIINHLLYTQKWNLFDSQGVSKAAAKSESDLVPI